MKTFCIPILLLIYQTTSAQDTTWKKIRIDSSLSVELPGMVEKGPVYSVGKYSYEGVMARTNSILFTVLVGTSKEEIIVRNKSDYREAMNEMAKGFRQGAEERKWTPSFSDVECDSIPGKRMDYSGTLKGTGIKGTNYFFLVNGLSYNLNVIFFNSELSSKDSADINHFVSSIDFPGNIREMQFESRSDLVGYNAGRLVGAIIIIAIIAGVILFVVKNL